MQSFRAGGNEILWQGDRRYWPDHAPILFPLISQMPGGHINHGGRTYPMPPHGFAKDRNFAVSQPSATGCVFELRDDEATRACYPFAFLLHVGYELTAGGLLCTVEVENPNDEPLPADVGFHPGFNWPLEPGRPREDYLLLFEKEEPSPVRPVTDDPAMLLPGGLPTPVERNLLRPRDELFQEGPIVFDGLESRSVAFGAPDGPVLRVDFPDSPNLALWTIPGAPYLCIEPWQGLPAEVGFDGPLVEKPGIALIPSGQSSRWRLGVTLQPDGVMKDRTRRF